VSNTQDAQRISRKDVALTFCALEPVSIVEKNAVFTGLARHDSEVLSSLPSQLLCYNVLQKLQSLFLDPTLEALLVVHCPLHCLLTCVYPLLLCN